MNLFGVVNPHCELCNCPADIWKPLDTFPSDRSCEFFSDVFDAVWELEEQGRTNPINYYALCERFRADYPEIPDFNASLAECYEIMLAEGVIYTKRK